MSSPSFSRVDTPASGLEPGDRFEIVREGAGERLRLPRVFGPGGFALDRLEDPDGHPLEMAFDPAGHRLIVPELNRVLPDAGVSLWLEYQSPGRLRLVADRVASPPANGTVTTEQGIPIVLDSHDWAVIAGGSGPQTGLREFDLRSRPPGSRHRPGSIGSSRCPW